jgi:hypothetical protein
MPVRPESAVPGVLYGVFILRLLIEFFYKRPFLSAEYCLYNKQTTHADAGKMP